MERNKDNLGLLDAAMVPATVQGVVSRGGRGSLELKPDAAGHGNDGDGGSRGASTSQTSSHSSYTFTLQLQHPHHRDLSPRRQPPLAELHVEKLVLASVDICLVAKPCTHYEHKGPDMAMLRFALRW